MSRGCDVLAGRKVKIESVWRVHKDKIYDRWNQTSLLLTMTVSVWLDAGIECASSARKKLHHIHGVSLRAAILQV